MSETPRTLIEGIRRNKRLCNMLNWEANCASPLPKEPQDALKGILDHPRRREKVLKELRKFTGIPIDLDRQDSPCVVALAEVIRDYRDDWEEHDHAGT